MPVICPCCQQQIPVDRAPADALEMAPLSNYRRKIVKALSDAYPRRVSMHTLIDACYGDDPDGGPENPEGVIMVAMNFLRRKLPEYGWTITKNHGGNGNKATYTLLPVERS